MTPARACWPVVVVAILGAACGDDSTLVPDAGDAAVSPDGGADPFAPAPPALPTLTPCPEGWREVVRDEGVTTCE